MTSLTLTSVAEKKPLLNYLKRTAQYNLCYLTYCDKILLNANAV